MTIKKTDKPVLPTLSITKIGMTDRGSARPPAPGRAAPSEGPHLEGRASSAPPELADAPTPATSTSCGPAEDSDLRIEQPDAGRALAARRARRHADRRRTGGRVRCRAGARRARAAVRARPARRRSRRRARWARASSARYDRQLRYFSDVSSGELPPSEYQRRLREARVLILGVGGLGTGRRTRFCAAGSASSCCSTATRWRRATSIARSCIASATSAARRPRRRREALAEFDSSCRLTAVARRLESVEAVRAAAEGVDFVVNGADWPAHDIERWVNAACFDARRALHHDEPLAAGRSRGPAVRARHHRLLRLPGADLPGRVPALRRARRPAPRAGVARRPRSARCAPSSAARWRSRRSTS